MTEKLFETALGMVVPWHVAGADFNAQARTLTIRAHYAAGSRFAVPSVAGEHPVHEIVAKRCRHLNFFQHKCFLEIRVPRGRLPDGPVRQIEPLWAGMLSGLTLLFDALVEMLCRQMTFAAAARVVDESWHRVSAICERYVELTLAQADFFAVHELAIDETLRARGHDYITLAANAVERRALAVAEGRSVETVGVLAGEWAGCDPQEIGSASIYRSPAFIEDCGGHLPNTRITFDRFHAAWHASTAVNKMRRIEQRSDRSLKGTRLALLKERFRLSAEAAADLAAQITRKTTTRSARTWVYKERLHEALERKQINVMRTMLQHQCTCVMRSEIAPVKEVASLVRRRLDGIVACALTQQQQTNGFLEALNGLFQAAKHRARGFTCMSTIRAVIFPIAGKLDFRMINPHSPQPT